MVEERPDLAIVDGDLWKRVHARLETVRTAYGARGEPEATPGAGAGGVFTPPSVRTDQARHLRPTNHDPDQPPQEERRGLPLGRYRCSFQVTKGPAVCSSILSRAEYDVLRALRRPSRSYVY